MMRTVLVLGAGATKACGGPLTNEILPQAFEHRTDLEREGYLDVVDRFLVENFHLPPSGSARRSDDYPSLPLLLSLVDTAIDRRQPFAPGWDQDDLRHVRDGLEYMIFALLEHQLRSPERVDYHRAALQRLAEGDSLPTVISLNYDIIIDNTMVAVGEERGARVFPSYGCDIATPPYQQAGRLGTLLKIHGSLNWLYCPNCHRMDIGVSASGLRTAKVLYEIYQVDPLDQRYGCHGSPCKSCGTHVRPVLITPTHRKDYRNPHIAQVWYGAERALREAERVVFIGYSLPDDDVEVIYLLKRGLSHLPAGRITVVEYDRAMRGLRDHPVGARYRTLFGDVDWHTSGFQGWLTTLPT